MVNKFEVEGDKEIFRLQNSWNGSAVTVLCRGLTLCTVTLATIFISMDPMLTWKCLSINPRKSAIIIHKDNGNWVTWKYVSCDAKLRQLVSKILQESRCHLYHDVLKMGSYSFAFARSCGTGRRLSFLTISHKGLPSVLVFEQRKLIRQQPWFVYSMWLVYTDKLQAVRSLWWSIISDQNSWTPDVNIGSGTKANASCISYSD